LSILARGDRVIATGRSLDKLNEFTSSLNPTLAQRFRVSQLDVTEGEKKIHAKIALMAKFWGRIDILVNNAGSFVRSQISCRRLTLGLNCVVCAGLGLPGLVEEGGCVGPY
jgi:NADP-dependent 3-hydroxy acid dehydrogenase YdfG